MIAIRSTFLLSALVSLGACSPQSGSSPEDNAPSNNSTASSGAIAPAPRSPTPAPTTPTAAACADAITFVLDQSEFAAQEWKPYPAARLEAFRKGIADAFRPAANHACRGNARVAAALAPVRRILIQSGSGAAEPTFYRPDPGPRSELIFQYAFVEADLAVPDRAAIEMGLRCWADPERKECEDVGD